MVAGNEGSSRVLELAEMQLEGRWRRMMFLHGKWVDILLYGILRSEWHNETEYRAGHPFGLASDVRNDFQPETNYICCE